MSRNWMTPSEMDRLQVWFTFNDNGTKGTLPNQVWDYSGLGNHGYLGGSKNTIRNRWPLYTAGQNIHTQSSADEANYPGNSPRPSGASNAPIFGRQKRVQSQQVANTPAPADSQDLIITFDPLDPIANAATQFVITGLTRNGVAGVDNTRGSLYATNAMSTPLDLTSNSITFTGTTLVYRVLVSQVRYSLS